MGILLRDQDLREKSRINAETASFEPSPENGRPKSLASKLWMSVIPSVVVVLLVTGYATHKISQGYINTALERNAHVQVMAVAYEINSLLERCRKDLFFISQNTPDSLWMHSFFAQNFRSGGIPYRELAFISQKNQQHRYFVSNQNRIVELPLRDIPEIRPNPLLLYESIRNLSEGEVYISPITEVEHPFPTADNPNQRLYSRVIYFGIPQSPEADKRSGYLLLSIDVRQFRNILSLYNSPKSPLWAFPRTSELRFSYFFDKEGWILFQSLDPEKTDLDLSTDTARSGYTGTLGRPGIPSAFRPASVSGNFWKMVGEIREGKHGLIRVQEGYSLYGMKKEYYQAYAPIFFKPNPEKAPVVYGGVTYIDRSRLIAAAGYKHVDVMFVITLVTVFLVAAVIFFLSRRITRPIVSLTRSVEGMRATGQLKPIDVVLSDFETLSLKKAINNMIETMQKQIEEIQYKDLKIEQANLKEKAPLEENVSALLRDSLGTEIPEIVGYGPKIGKLKSEILKSAGVDVGVLIMGETGTGKQLTAESIHNHSRRSGRPFISINCGELDENLLLDTLFGHVKGAFTEAKADRKGAFLEADGGSLFLDEIQTASLAVQQALLRALAARKIKPLGSDRELEVDVRVIAATNADLTALIDQGKFRQDLYFRLKVITLQTPTLREQRENIPILTVHYLKQAQLLAQKSGLGLSKGALEKIKAYSWPGNVRELMNVITRAVVMSEKKIIHEDDIVLENQEAVSLIRAPGDLLRGEKEAPNPRNGVQDEAAHPPLQTAPPLFREDLNSRQIKACEALFQEKEISRFRYQEIIGGKLSSRTAIYDLQDLVKKGIVKKVGQGPATRYVLSTPGESVSSLPPPKGTSFRSGSS